MIIAPENFRDEELFDTVGELEKRGVGVVVASTRRGVCVGSRGGSAESELSLDEVVVEDYDAVVFVGGDGAEIFFDNDKALSIAVKAGALGKVVGAICLAPVILAKAGIVKGKVVSVWEGASADVERLGAKYTSEKVFADGRIVTGSGPSASRAFGRKIAELLG
jgi:protease I